MSKRDKDELGTQDDDAKLLGPLEEAQPGAVASQTEDTWEIRVTSELKRKLAGPW